MIESKGFICGSAYIQANAAFLNGSGSEKIGRSDVTLPKSIDINSSRIPYVSAQMLRFWLKKTVFRELKNIIPHYPSLNLVKYENIPMLNIIDDLFGYFYGKKITLPKQNEGLENAGIIRESPFKISPLISISLSPLLFTRENAFVHLKDGTPLPYSSQFYNTDLESSFGINLNTIGKYRIFQDRQEIDPDNIPEGLEECDGSSNGKIYRLKDHQAHFFARLHLLVESLMIVNGGAKLSQYGADVSPKVVVTAIQRGGNPILSKLLLMTSQGPILDCSKFIEKLHIGKKLNLFKSPIFIAYRQNYLLNEKEVKNLPEKVQQEVSKDIEIILTTPFKLVKKLIEFCKVD